METRRADGFILKSVDWSESSKILTVFTDLYGKISLMVKGAKRPNSTFRGQLETGCIVQFVYDFKEGRDVQIAKDASVRDLYSIALTENYSRFTSFLSCLEFTDILLEKDDPHPDIFSSLQSITIHLSTSKHPESFMIRYILELVDFLGFKLHLTECGVCGNPLEKQYQYSPKDGILCENCFGLSIFSDMKPLMYKCLRAIESLSLAELDKVSINPQLLNDILFLFKEYIEHHFNMKLQLKSVGTL